MRQAVLLASGAVADVDVAAIDAVAAGAKMLLILKRLVASMLC